MKLIKSDGDKASLHVHKLTLSAIASQYINNTHSALILFKQASLTHMASCTLEAMPYLASIYIHATIFDLKQNCTCTRDLKHVL